MRHICLYKGVQIFIAGGRTYEGVQEALVDLKIYLKVILLCYHIIKYGCRKLHRSTSWIDKVIWQGEVIRFELVYSVDWVTRWSCKKQSGKLEDCVLRHGTKPTLPFGLRFETRQFSLLIYDQSLWNPLSMIPDWFVSKRTMIYLSHLCSILQMWLERPANFVFLHI